MTATSITINGLSGQDLTINNPSTITATTGSINIASSSGYNLLVTGGGTMSATSGSVNLTATTSGTAANSVVFQGNQTFNGTTNINAAGINQSVIVNNAVAVVGNNSLTVTTPLLTLIGTGSITGNPFTYTSPGVTGSGTIANSTGSINLLSTSGTLEANAQNLAIIAEGSITETGLTTIDLSSNSGNGASLTLIAGFNFTPATSGQVNNNTTTTFTLGSTSSGSISLSGVSINTSSSAANSSAGNVLAVASGGSISLGTITTTGNSTSGTGGNVTLIGTGVSVGAISASAHTDGAVSISSATPIANGTVTVYNGTISPSSAAFSAQSGTYGGNISIGGAMTANGGITLATGGTGTIGSTSSSNTVSTTGLLSITLGTVDHLLSGIGGGLITVGTSPAQTIYIGTLGSLSVTAANSFSTSTSAINLGTRSLTLVSTGGSGSITINGGVTAGSISLTAGGSGSIQNGSLPATLTASTLTLVVGSGSIGASNSMITTTATTLNVTGGSAATAYVTDTSGDLFQMLAGGDVSTSGPGTFSTLSVTSPALTVDQSSSLNAGTNLTLNSTAGDIVINGNMSATNVTLNAYGNINQPLTWNVINTSNLNLFTTTGTALITTTNAATISANTAGALIVADGASAFALNNITVSSGGMSVYTNSAAVSINGSDSVTLSNGDFFLNAATSLTLASGSSLSANNFISHTSSSDFTLIDNGTISASNSFTIANYGNFNVNFNSNSGPSPVINAATFTVQAQGGNINFNSSYTFNATAASGTSNFNATDAINLGGSNTFTSPANATMNLQGNTGFNITGASTFTTGSNGTLWLLSNTAVTQSAGVTINAGANSTAYLYSYGFLQVNGNTTVVDSSHTSNLVLAGWNGVAIGSGGSVTTGGSMSTGGAYVSIGANAALTANSGSILIDNTPGVTIGSGASISANNITITYSAGTLTLTDNGTITASNSLLMTNYGNYDITFAASSGQNPVINAGTFFVNAQGGNINVNSNYTFSSTAASGTSGFSVPDAVNLNSAATFTAAAQSTISLFGGSAVNISGATTFNNGSNSSISITSNGTITEGANVTINPGSNSSMSITTPGVLNLNANTIVSTSSNSSSLTLGGGAALNLAGSQTVKSSNGSIVLGSVALTLGAESVVEADNGGITLMLNNSSGSLVIDNGASVKAYYGNLFIQDYNTNPNSISIGQNTWLYAYAPTPMASEGNIYVITGYYLSGTLVASSNPSSNASDITEGNGTVYFFGLQGITATDATVQLEAKGSNLFFSNNGSFASAISIDSGSTLEADPPIIGGAPASSPTIVRTPDISSGTTAVAGLLSASLSALATVPVASTGSPSGVITASDTVTQITSTGQRAALLTPAPVVEHYDSAKITGDVVLDLTDKQVDEIGGPLVPMMFTPPGAATIGTSTGVRTLVATCAKIKHAGRARVSVDNRTGIVTLASGEVLIVPQRETTVRAGTHTVVAAAGAIVLIRSYDDVLKVRNLSDQGGKGIEVRVDNGSLQLKVAEELVVGHNDGLLLKSMRADKVSRRLSHGYEIGPERKLIHSEVSLVSLFRNSAVLSHLKDSDNREDRALSARLMKMAACMQTVSAGHGSYSQVGL